MNWRLVLSLVVCAVWWLGLVVVARAGSLGELEKVNQSVNWHGEPGWVCKDYAFAKHTRLLQEGFPAGDMHLADVVTEDGTPHMVLIAKAEGKEVVLDSRYTWTQKWADLHYTLIDLWP